MRFNSNRLNIARKRKLLNQKQLAALIGVTPLTISRWEKEHAEPTTGNVETIGRVLEYPVEFFWGPDIDEPDVETTSFRSQSNMSAKVRNASLAAGAVAYLVSDWFEERFNLPPADIPDLHLFNKDASEAARLLRQEWSLGEKPIPNMIQLLESKGVRVFSLTENTVEVNAYSLWREGKPHVFLNTVMSAERSRFDAAHELAHLVLHQDGKVKGREAEDQANLFAASFLMPKADVLGVLPRVSHLGQLMVAKKRWKVSLAALANQVHRLGIISDWRYRDFMIEMGQRGYRKCEPESIERETSLVWKKAMNALWAEKVTQRDIARDLNLPDEEVSGLLFGIIRTEQKEIKEKPTLEIFSAMEA